MAKNTTVETPETPVEGENVGTTAAENEPAQKTEKKGAKKPVSEKKPEEKPGILKRAKNWCKQNKPAIITGVVSFGAGVGASIGAAEISRRRTEKRQKNAYIQQDGTTGYGE